MKVAIRSSLVVASALAGAIACRRGVHDVDGASPPAPIATASESAVSSSSPASASASSTASSSASANPGAKSAVSPTVTIEVAVAGDVIPQSKVLAVPIEDVLAKLPACWRNADARILNLEAPIGDRGALPTDRATLAFAAPPSWFADLYAASHASAFVAANNHACDLGPEGLASTMKQAAALSAPIVGVAADDPWKRLDVVERSGRHVCVVAWTTFLNDKGRKQEGCLAGSAGAKVARAELTHGGLDTIDRELSAPGRWDGCDARIAVIHGGREYRAQIRPVLDQANVAAAYVDAVIVSHPHVPDFVEVIAAPAPRDEHASEVVRESGRAAGRGVPLFRSLGNFVSNQGIAWTLGMSVDPIDVDGVADPLRDIWTRVSMIARLAFSWDAGAPTGSAPNTVKYGYSLAFTERTPVTTIVLRPLPLPGDDRIAAALAKGVAKGPQALSPLLSDRCLVSGDGAPTCDGRTVSSKSSPR